MYYEIKFLKDAYKYLQKQDLVTVTAFLIISKFYPKTPNILNSI